MRPFSNIYTINGKIAVDYVGKFEDLKNDISKIQKILKLPKSKLTYLIQKKHKKNYLKYYSKESKKLVEEIWKKNKFLNILFLKQKLVFNLIKICDYLFIFNIKFF